MWPFKKPAEKRYFSNAFSDAFIKRLISSAKGIGGDSPEGLAALEMCAGLWSRSLAAAKVMPEDSNITAAITPNILGILGRSLITNGEALFLIDVDERGRLKLLPSCGFNIKGNTPNEADWEYQISIAGPSGQVTSVVNSESVIHCRFQTDIERPWRGVSPFYAAQTTVALLAGLESRLAEEASACAGYLLPVPADGGDGSNRDKLGNLKADIASLKGQTGLVETVAAGWGEGKQSAPSNDWEPKRFGANPPETLDKLRTSSSYSLIAACGIPVDLLIGKADGTSQREAWRRFTLGALSPVARSIAYEFSIKLNEDISLDLSCLHGADIVGRSQAYSKLTAAGMSPTEAALLSGLTTVNTA